ncbi:transketolase [Aeromicrobium sp.]|uniref:transketolase n=1 Tax=Aeromicrobium sp. TaxID=1871063 RepID=UPI0030C209D9
MTSKHVDIDTMSRAPLGGESRRSFAALERVAATARWLSISTVAASQAGHVGGPLSAMDLITALYFDQMRIDPAEPDRIERDRFVLSKGHSSIALYSVMALRGYFDVLELATFDKIDSRLQGHPDRTRLPGLDASSGSLGQGLSFGMGLALGARMAGRDSHTWVMLGDGEIQEGMVWEAVHVAARYRLANLTAIVDHNGLQQYGWEPDGNDRGDRGDPWRGIDLGAVFRSFGWRVIEIDGHDFPQILAAYELARGANQTRPTVILASTIKGKGISYAEHQHAWHNGIASQEQLDRARVDLGLDDIGEM